MPKVIQMKTRGKKAPMIDKVIILKKKKQQSKPQKKLPTKVSQNRQRPSELKQAVSVLQYKCAVPDQSNEKEKVCEICDEWVSKRRTTICRICDDIYHTDCIESNEQSNRKRLVTSQQAAKKRRNSKKWTCQRCVELRRYIYKTQMDEEDKEDICQKCQEVIECKEHSECLRCKEQYHSSCLIQKEVEEEQEQEEKEKEKEQNHSSSNHKVPLCKSCYKLFIPIPSTLYYDNQISGNSNSNTCMITNNYLTEKGKKTKLTYLLPVIQDEKLRQECYESLMFALHCQNIKFNDDLLYDNYPSPLVRDNNAKLEPCLHEMTIQNLEVFNEFKKLSSKGYYGQVKVEYTENQGFIVKAVGHIPANTIICEYAGRVFYYAEAVFHESDSIMTLLQTNRAATTLVIVPDKFGNLAKYLSGINNSKKSSKTKKQNVMSVRCQIDGEARVLLVACKDIKAGDILYYDYNEGGQNSYDTNNFE